MANTEENLRTLPPPPGMEDAEENLRVLPPPPPKLKKVPAPTPIPTATPNTYAPVGSYGMTSMTPEEAAEVEKEVYAAEEELFKKGYGSSFDDMVKKKEFKKEERDRLLKEARINPKSAPMGKLTSIITKPLQELMSGEHHGAVPYAIAAAKAAVEQAGKITSGTTDYDPITSSELWKRGVFFTPPDNPQQVYVDLNKLGKTSYSSAKTQQHMIDNVLRVLGKENDPAARQEVTKWANYKGSSVDPTIKKQLTEIADAATLNIPSWAVGKFHISKSPLLKRPEDRDVLTPKLMEQAKKHLQTAKSLNNIQEWKTKEFGVIKIFPDQELHDIEDAIYANQMSHVLTNLANTSVTPIIQEVGQMLFGAGFGGFSKNVFGVIGSAVSPAGQAAIKSVPFAAPAIKAAEKIVPAAGVAKVMSETQFIGEPGQEAKDKAFIENFALMSGMDLAAHVAAKGHQATIGILNRARDAAESRFGVDSDPIFSAAARAKNYEEFKRNPINTDKKIDAQDFKIIKELANKIEDVKADTPRLIQEVKQTTGNDPATIEGARSVIAEIYQPNPPKLVQEIDKNIETYHLLTQQQTVDEKRVGDAVRFALLKANELPQEIELLRQLSDNDPKIKTSVNQIDTIIDKLRPYFNDPKRTEVELNKLRPDVIQPFKTILGSKEMSPQEFKARVFFNMGNSSLDVTPENVRLENRALNRTQKTFPEVAGRFDPAYGKNPELLQEVENLKGIVTKADDKIKNIKSQLSGNIANVLSTGKVPKAMAPHLQILKANVDSNKPITNTYRNTLKEVAELTKTDINYILSGIRNFNNALELSNKAVEDLGAKQAVLDMLNPQDFTNKKIKFVRSDHDRILHSLLKNSPQENVLYISGSMFKDYDVESDFLPLIKTILYTRIPNRESVQDEIETIQTLLLMKNKMYPKSQLQGINAANNVLKSYEKDIQNYHNAYAAINTPGTSWPAMLSSLRNARDAIRNPTLALEIKNMIDSRMDDFFLYMDDLNLPLTKKEQLQLWDYLTGDQYAQLKNGMMNYDLLNYDVISSILKSTNKLGRNVIDLYADIYSSTFGQELDKVAFHAYMVNPSNDLDSSKSVFFGLLGEHINKFGKIKKDMKSPFNIGLMDNFANIDAAEQYIEAQTGLSLGAYLSDLNNSVREGRKVVQQFITETVVPKMIKTFMYKNLDNQVLLSMDKSAKGLIGFDPDFFIDTRREDGTHGLTNFGVFLKEIYNDKKWLERLKLESETTQGIAQNTYQEIADLAVSRGYVDGNEVNKSGRLLKEELAKQVLDYWNFYAHDNITELFNGMLEWRKFESDVLAENFKRNNVNTLNINRIESHRNGPNFPEQLWRQQRLENKLLFVDDLLSPYAVSGRDLRLDKSFGTSKDAMRSKVDKFTQMNTMNSVENLIHELFSSTLATHTQHARSNLSSIAVNCKYFGYDLAANWIMQRASLLDNSSMALQAVRFEAMFQWLRSVEGKAAYVAKPIWIASDVIFPWVSTYGTLNMLSSLLKGSVQSAEVGFAYSNKSVGKFLNVPLSLPRTFAMIFTQDASGKPRAEIFKNTYGNPKAYEIASEVLQRYRDPIHNEHINRITEYARQGKSYTGIQSLNVQLAQATQDFFFSKFKENFELHNSKMALDSGRLLAEGIKGYLNAGDTQNAFRVVDEALSTMSKAKAFDVFKTMERAHRNGVFEESLYTFLPLYHDLNIGRFGITTLPTIVQQQKRYIPGMAIFASAINMRKLRDLSLVRTAFSKSPEKARARAAFLEVQTSFFATYGLLRLLSQGLPEQMAAHMLTVEQKMKLGTSDDNIDLERAYAKFVTHGLGLPWDLGSMSEFGLGSIMSQGLWEGSKTAVAEMMGFTSSARGAKLPVFGLPAEKMTKSAGLLVQMAQMQLAVPAHVTTHSDNIAEHNDWWTHFGNEHIQAYVTGMQSTNPSVRARAQEVFSIYSNSLPPRFYDSLFKMTPITAFSDMLSNPFVGYHVWKTLQENKNADVVVSKNIKTKTPGKVMQDAIAHPVTNMMQYSILPIQPIYKQFYEVFGLDKIDADTYADYLDNWVTYLSDNGVMKKEFAQKMAEAGKKNYFVMTGKRADQADHKGEGAIQLDMDEKLMKRREADGYSKGLNVPNK